MARALFVGSAGWEVEREEGRIFDLERLCQLTPNVEDLRLVGIGQLD